MSDIKATILQHDRMTPRYTSYPPANHFSDGYGGDTLHAGLRAIPAGAGISLYLHIPFCTALCHYCGCLTFATQRQDRVKDYLQLLLAEAHLVAADLAPSIDITHLHLGGGSPTILSADDFTCLLDELRQIIPFAPQIEIALEADPRQLTEEKIAAYAATGVSRISFGVQDFDQTVMTSINRAQPAHLTRQAVDWCRQHGIRNINFDLMYGLPHQSVDSMRATIATAIDMAPSRIAFFGYAHVPWMKKHMAAIDMAQLPDGELRYDLFVTGRDLLAQVGYRAVGIDHFVQPGDPMLAALESRRLRRNFQGYTTDKAAWLIGLGASAIGELPDGYSQNTADLTAYKAAIDAGTLPVKRGWQRQPSDALHAAIIEEIMCYHTVDLTAYQNIYKLPADYFADALAELQPLVAQELVTYDKGRLTVAPDARLLTRLVAAAFDKYVVRDQAQRHARTV